MSATGLHLDDEVKIAIIRKFAPTDIQQHLRLEAARYRNSYDATRIIMEEYLLAGEGLGNEGSVQPMELGMIQRARIPRSRTRRRRRTRTRPRARRRKSI